MELVLRRHASLNGFTLGELTATGIVPGAMNTVMSLVHIWTCEDVIRELPHLPGEDDGAWVKRWKVYGQTAIPARRYKIEMLHSNHFNRMLPHLIDVPGYAGILIHPGNKAADTNGCILPGLIQTASGVGQSVKAFDLLLALIVDACAAGGCWIDIRNPIPGSVT